MARTNALRILETAGVSFSGHEYDFPDGKIDGRSVAAKIGRGAEIEETGQLLDTVLVSAGRIGLQFEIATGDLARVTGAEFRDLV